MTHEASPSTVLIVSRFRLLRERVADMISARGLLAIACTPDGVTRDAAPRGTIAGERETLAVIDVRDNRAAHVVRCLTERTPPCRVLLLGTVDDEAAIVSSLDAGATGVLDADCSEEELWLALTRLRLDDVIVTPHVLAALLRRRAEPTSETPSPTLLDQLTAREREVLTLLARGCSNKEIAGALHITVATVKHHVHRILEKLQVPRRAAAVAQFRGLVQPPAG